MLNFKENVKNSLTAFQHFLKEIFPLFKILQENCQRCVDKSQRTSQIIIKRRRRDSCLRLTKQR